MSTNQDKLNEQLFNVIADEKVSDEARLKKVKYLVRLGADVNTRLYGKSVLSKAIEQNAGAEVVQFLRENGANEWVISKEEAERLGKQFWDDKGYLKSLDEIKELLKKGADVNVKNNKGSTALMLMAGKGNLEFCQYLVDIGADLEVKNNWKSTALMFAAYSGHLNVVKYLAQSGADVDVKDEWNRTALDMARKWGKADFVKFLEEYQKKNSAQKNNGDKTSGSQIVKANEGR